ncbi:tRNA 4-thiouridine(8) synthase ThiI [bacterium]|nr:tRNA 4-thiouridine(8) synthase ThiI [bacterium]
MGKVLKAVALYSGGLDSILAIKLMLDLGCYVEAIGFRTPFFDIRHDVPVFEGYPKVDLKILDITERFLEALASPRHGFGKHLNPCIDCKIIMLSEARLYMEKEGTDFVFTGEVLGQRPMSQRKDTLRLIEKEAGFSGKLLRPLSARLLPPTDMENEGLIDRERLLDFSGRSRKRQFSMARAMNLQTYSTPSGGCMLTDVNFANRLRPFIDKGRLCPDIVRWLKIGRHFELTYGSRLVVGRDHEDNEMIMNLAGKDDLLLKTVSVPGPVAVIIGRNNLLKNSPMIRLAASITAGYADFRAGSEVEIVFGKEEEFGERIRVSPMPRKEMDPYRV